MSVSSDSTIMIAEVAARPILDSRGWPTVEVRARLDDGTRIVASAPAGASTGEHEAAELRDHDGPYSGRGVRSASTGINGEIAEALTGREWSSIVDHTLRELDGTTNYSRLGANAVVAVSIMAARAFAHAAGEALHDWIATRTGSTQRLPVPHFNVLNGGAHAANALDFQEFMIAPVGAESEEHAVQIGSEVYHALAEAVRRRFGTAGLGDEGGFAPQIEDPRMALDLLVDAIGSAGYTPGVDDVAIALDPAANSFYRGQGRYRVNGQEIRNRELVEYYCDLIDTYPIRSLEDGFCEDDPEGWIDMAQHARRRVQLIGDDLYVTNRDLIREGAARGYSTAVLIKPNQVGTVTETVEAIIAAREEGMRCMISHRSGETGGTFIADLAVGTGLGQIKAGAPARGERVAKYNRLTEIELDHPDIPYGLG